jgi:CubicO group peptidase (beta-lactamase class C family)
MGHAPLPGGQTLATELSPYRIASLTKQFTSAATVLAMAERAIPLSTPAIELLPSLAPGWRADPSITVEQLLEQVAGLRESVDGAAVAALGGGPSAFQDAARLVVRAGNERAPGERCTTAATTSSSAPSCPVLRGPATRTVSPRRCSTAQSRRED